MNKMDMNVLFLLPICIFMSCIHDGYLTRVFNLNSQCGKRISMIKEDIKGAILEFYSYNEGYVTCTVELGGWFEKMAMHFTQFNTSSSNLYVEIRYGDSWDEGRPITGMPEKLTSASFNDLNRIFTGDWMSLFFRINGNSSLYGFRVFELVVNVFSTGLCDNWEFKCDNGRCIDKDLKCNGHNPCGDSSDCIPVGITSGVVAVICVSVASGGSCILSIVYYCVKDTRKKRRSQQRTQSLTRSQDRSDTGRGDAVPSSMGEGPTETDDHEVTTNYNGPDVPELVEPSFDWNRHIREAQMYGYQEPGLHSSDPPNYDTVMADRNRSDFSDQADQVPSVPDYNDVIHGGNTPTAPNLDEELNENSPDLLPSYMDVLQDADAYQLNLEGGDSVTYMV